MRLRPADEAGGRPVHALGMGGELLDEIVRELQSCSRSPTAFRVAGHAG